MDGIVMFRLSPDERQIAIQRAEGEVHDLWLLDSDRGIASRFTADRTLTTQPVWSPDGRIIVFTHLGSSALFRKPANGIGGEQVAFQGPKTGNVLPLDWSRDGHWVLTRQTSPDTKYDVWKLPMTRHPQQNGRHERMHLTLKQETTRPAAHNILQQQAKFDAFLQEFNQERPQEALAMKSPAQVYTASRRTYLGIPQPHYPFHDKTVVVTSCGRLCLFRKKINLSTSLAGQAVGIKEVDNGIWLVSFMDYDLGYIDLEEKTLQPLDNPFGPKLLPMS